MNDNLSPAGQVTANTSLFTYPRDLSVDDYAHPSHVPPYLDAIVATANQSVIDACNGDAHCIFDTIVTNNQDIGIATMTTDENNNVQQNQSSKAHNDI